MDLGCRHFRWRDLQQTINRRMYESRVSGSSNEYRDQIVVCDQRAKKRDLDDCVIRRTTASRTGQGYALLVDTCEIGMCGEGDKYVILEAGMTQALSAVMHRAREGDMRLTIPDS